MDGVINLLYTVLQSPWRDKYMGSLLFGCTEHQAFTCNDSSDLQPVVALINSRLNDRSSRYEGLLLLKTFLSQCPDEIFSANAFSWASQSLKTIEVTPEKHGHVKSLSELPYLVLRDVIEASAQFPDVSKQMLSVMSKLVYALTVDSRKASCDSLKCLQSCMKYYSGQCISYKGPIEKLLLNLICCKDETLVYEASNCFQLLVLLCGSGGIKGSKLISGSNNNFTTAWNQMLSKVVGSLNAILDRLYEDVNEVKSSPSSNEVFAVPLEEEENPVLTIQSFSTKYVNFCQYLHSMLTNPLPAAKSIPLEEILGIICRSLAITCSSIKDRVSSEMLALSVCLPQIHSASFSVLTALIASSRLNLLPFGSLVIKLAMQSLKWTGDIKDWPSGIRKPYSSIRYSAYICLSLWLRVSASASCAEEVADELISMALLDIVPSREKVKLMSADLSSRPHGKHHKRRKLEVTAGAAASPSKLCVSYPKCAWGNDSANGETCCAALDMLASLLQSVGPFLKPSLHKIIQDMTVSLLVDIQRSSSTLNFKQVGGSWCGAGMIVPYQCDARCRLSLLKLLLALVVEPHSHKWPSPLGLAAHIFQSGHTDPNIEVSTFCMTATRTVERLIHPSAATLNFPISLSDMMETKQLGVNVQATQIATMESVENSTEEENFGSSKLAEEKDYIPSKKKSFDPRCQLFSEYEVSNSDEQQMQHTSSTSEVIVLSDGEVSPSLKLAMSPPNNEEVQSSVISSEPSPNGLVLVRRVESLDGNQSIQKAKLTTLKSIGIQVDSEPIMNPDEPVIISPSIDSSSHPPLLVLKLPIEKCGPVSMKDFSQQWVAKRDCMDVLSFECEEVNIAKKNLEPNRENFEMNCNLETNTNVVPINSENDTNNCREVLVVEQENLNSNICNDLNSHCNEDTNNSLLTCKANGSGRINTCNAVEVVELDDRQSDRDVPVARHKKLVELDVENLSEGEEMISCFVDVSSESE